MRIRFNACDVDLQFKIKGWQATDGDDIRAQLIWTEDEFSLKGKYIDYSLNSELLMNGEIVYLHEMLERVLRNELKEECVVGFAEPDLTFKLTPAKRLYDIPGKVIYRNGYVDREPEMEITVRFWCGGGLGSNRFSMVFSPYEIDALYTYISVIMGVIEKDDPKVIRFIEDRVILPE